jgi:hypothetical protein
MSPVFVIGSPRSGTTALAFALACHSALWTSGESQFLFELFGDGRAEAAFQRAQRPPRDKWLSAQHVGRAEYLRSLGLGIDSLFRGRSGGRRWIDHTPHYVHMADTLAEMFPTSQFIHIVRDGRRVVDSMVHFGDRLEATGQDPAGRPRWASDFAEACRTWAASVQAGVDFCTRQPVRSRMVVNEDLLADPQGEMRRLQRFLGLPYEPRPGWWIATQRINSSFPAATRNSGPANRTGWQSWTPAQRTIFRTYAAELLAAHGLARS